MEMDNVLLTVLLLSAFGTILALFVFAVKAVFKRNLSKRFLYYIWVLVLLRLVIPVGIPVQIINIPQSEEQESVVSEQDQTTEGETYQSGTVQDVQDTDDSAVDNTATAKSASILSKISKRQLLYGGLLFCWLLGVFIGLGHFFGSYHRFAKKIIQTNQLPSTVEMGRFNAMRPNKRLQLRYNSYVKSPMQIGIVHPYIILPSDLDCGNEEERYYILLHEIIHYTKKDLLLKWMAMVITTFHWFNPVMILVRREINNACELACDETVIRCLTVPQRKQYGEMLLALSGNPIMPAGIVSATLSEPKKILKERIVSIKRFRKNTLSMVVLAILIGITLTGCSSFFGIADTEGPNLIQVDQSSTSTSSQPTSTQAPSAIIESATTASPDLPLTIPERTSSLEAKPLNEASTLPLLRLPEQTQIEYPNIYSWKYQDGNSRFDTFSTIAEEAASLLWSDYTQKEDLASEDQLWLYSSITDTEYGPYQEKIRVTSSSIDFEGLWQEYEETPYHYGTQVDLEAEEIIEIARKFVKDFLGEDTYTSGSPFVEENERGWIDDGVQSAQTAYVYWRYTVDGLPVDFYSLTVKIINGKVASMYYQAPALIRTESESPDFILNAEEALYCINYTRSWLTSEESVFIDCPVLVSVTPILADGFTEDTECYVPAWEFIIASDDESSLTYSIYVSALTGEVNTNVNEGNEGIYSSPYVH